VPKSTNEEIRPKILPEPDDRNGQMLEAGLKCGASLDIN